MEAVGAIPRKGGHWASLTGSWYQGDPYPRKIQKHLKHEVGGEDNQEVLRRVLGDCTHNCRNVEPWYTCRLCEKYC